MYFVSFGGAMGGISRSRTRRTVSVPNGSTAIFRGVLIEVAGSGVPALAFAPVHGQLDDVAVGAAEGLVAVEQRLDVVLAGGELGQAADGIAECGGVDDRFAPGGEAVDVDAEDELRSGAIGDLEPRLGLAVGREQEEHPAVEGRSRERRRKGYGEPDRSCGEGGHRQQDGESGGRQRGEERTGTADVHGPSGDFDSFSGENIAYAGRACHPD